MPPGQMPPANEGCATRSPNEPFAIGRLKRRADFLRAAKGKRWHGKALSLQAVARGDADAPARVGFTLTRKVGGAVIRNRARRRLKEAMRLGSLPCEAGHDYVVIGRIEAIRQPFEALKAELARAVRGVRAGKSRRAATPRLETTGTFEAAGTLETTAILGTTGNTDRPAGRGHRTRP